MHVLSFAELVSVGSECEEELQKKCGLSQLETCLQHCPVHVRSAQVWAATGQCSTSTVWYYSLSMELWRRKGSDEQHQSVSPASFSRLWCHIATVRGCRVFYHGSRRVHPLVWRSVYVCILFTSCPPFVSAAHLLTDQPLRSGGLSSDDCNTQPWPGPQRSQQLLHTEVQQENMSHFSLGMTVYVCVGATYSITILTSTVCVRVCVQEWPPTGPALLPLHHGASPFWPVPHDPQQPRRFTHSLTHSYIQPLGGFKHGWWMFQIYMRKALGLKIAER